MKYLRVKNWNKFQYDAGKQLPWIKFFTTLLAPTKEPWYSELPDATKALLHHLWLMAMAFNDRIPETWITKEKLNLQSKVKLDLLLQSGSIWFEDESGNKIDSYTHARAPSGLSDSNALHSPRGESEGRGFDSDAEFSALIAMYPRPLGKKAARRHFDRTVRTPEDLAAIKRALDSYVRATTDTDSRFIQHASTWFNNWRDWEHYTEESNANRNDKRDSASGKRIEPRPTAADFGMRTIADVLAAKK